MKYLNQFKEENKIGGKIQMKKFLSVLIIMVCIFSLFIVTTNASSDPMAVKFDEALGLLDYFYDYDYDYMIRIATDEFISWDDDDPYKPVPVSAESFDAALHKYFVITDSQIKELREVGNRDYSVKIYDEETWEVIEEIPFFDEATQTYTICFNGGFGGSLPPREYLGYVKNGETYDVYYRHLTYEYLEDVLPEGTTEDDIIGDEWSETVEYGGKIYQSGPDGYYTIKSRDDYGRKYTVEMNGDVVRIISCVNYTQGQQPDTFDDKQKEDEVIYDIPENNNVSIPENDCFEGNTTVKVEEIKSGNTMQTVNKAMETVAEKYVAYEFTATKDNAAVQPNGKLAVTFAIPEGYSNNVTVFYMAKDGKLEKLNTTVNATERTATAELEHFSTYILADESSNAHEHSYKKTVTPPTCTTEGYTTYTCACGDTYTDDKLAASGHSFGEWKETKAPTNTEEGEEKRECANCDHFETRPINAQAQPDTEPSVSTEPSTDVPQPDSESTEPNTEETQSNTEETQPSTNTEATASDDKGTDNEGSDKIGIIIAVIAVAVIALGAVVVVVVRKKK